MSHDPLPPTQFDSVEDGRVVRTAADKASRYSQISHVVEVVLVFVTAVAMTVLAVAVLRTAQTNHRGVERILSCTTPGRPCYEDQKIRTDDLVADLILRLDESHLVVECMLLVDPPSRSGETEGKCRDEARAKTILLRTELQDQIRLRSQEARKRNS